MSNFITPEEENQIVTRQHVVLVVALTLDAVSLALLLKHTPQLMVEFRKYLFLIQASYLQEKGEENSKKKDIFR